MLSRKSLVVLILALVLVLPAATQVSAITHLQVGTGNLVTLQYNPGDQNFYRVRMNGKVDTSPFKPSSQTFILMDIDWYFTGGTAGYTYPLTLSIVPSTGSPTDIFIGQGLANADGNGVANIHLTSGLTVGSGRFVGVTLPVGVTTVTLYLHGYVA